MNESIKLAIEYIENVPDDRQQVTHIDRGELVAALRKPDCRTCIFKLGRNGWDNEGCVRRIQGEKCISGNQYKPLPPVVLWETE